MSHRGRTRRTPTLGDRSRTRLLRRGRGAVRRPARPRRARRSPHRSS
jgi:hypothetical protein